ncbi:hypothetical protein DT076_14880 [Desertihabitans brevis]|uniref:Uncharacterized protein n=1 Tax=Desertihabitans brevis TaxID=2268447 RepID=A0A367YSJ8_9ACTN|nr:hypothetical protein [Desertihabitans brevis]RCK68529.1 hypothetical protein DT076_14880 [Desertihabitans brevis]
MDSLRIDCDSCAVRGTGCDGCVISVLMGSRPDEEPVVLDGDERRALTALAGHGLLPPLRMAPRRESTG